MAASLKICIISDLNFERIVEMSTIVEKILILLDNKCVGLMACYQSLRLAITGDKETYQMSNHFLVKRKITTKRKYCVFRMVYPNYSLFATANAYIFLYEWATNRGLIPIVDLEYQYSYLQGRLGENNVWECCFEQPISIKEVKSQDYVLVRGVGTVNSILEKTCCDINGKKNDRFIHVVEEDWRRYYANLNKYIKKCWVFKQEILDDFKSTYETQIRKAKNILGVSLREGFSEERYNRLSDIEKEIFDRHPRVPDIDETIEIVKRYMDIWKCDYIFLATIYQESVDRFLAEFGDKVITVDRIRKSTTEWGTEQVRLDMTEQEIYEKGKMIDHEELLIPYVKEIIGLSRCDYLVAAKGGGTAAALSINGGNYKDIHILADENKSSMY